MRLDTNNAQTESHWQWSAEIPCFSQQTLLPTKSCTFHCSGSARNASTRVLLRLSGCALSSVATALPIHPGQNYRPDSAAASSGDHTDGAAPHKWQLMLAKLLSLHARLPYGWIHVVPTHAVSHGHESLVKPEVNAR